MDVPPGPMRPLVSPLLLLLLSGEGGAADARALPAPVAGEGGAGWVAAAVARQSCRAAREARRADRAALCQCRGGWGDDAPAGRKCGGGREL